MGELTKVLNFHLESWAALAPGLETRDDWRQWLQNPVAIEQPLGKVTLGAVPPMLRRRFNTVGKCAMAASLPLVEGIDNIPSVFASRHGDTELSFSLLRSIGSEEPMSPTSFSLAVHNAVAGLFSIARKDTSAVTAIAAVQGLVLQALFEAIGQLQHTERVLCVIYDIPLPDFYRQHFDDEDVPFPYAVAMILNRAGGQSFRLEPGELEPSKTGPGEHESMRLVSLISGLHDKILLQQNGSAWRVARVEA